MWRTKERRRAEAPGLSEARAFALIFSMVLVPGAARGAEQPYRVAPETVVSASRIPVPAEQVGSAVTVITGEELERRQIRAVSDALRSVPGVAVSRVGPVGSFTQVRIRGAEANQTLVLIDGIEVNDPSGQSEFDFGNLLNAEVARIEILRGPQSALYGSDAIGGVINIITKTPPPGLSATARAEAGSFASRDALANVGYGGERFYGAATIERFMTNGVSVADADAGNGEADAYDNTTVHLKGGIRPFEFLRLDAVGILIDADRELDVTEVMVGAIDNEDTSQTEQRFGRLSAQLDLFDGAWEHLASASYALADRDFFDGTGARTFAAEGERTRFDYQTNIHFDTAAVADAAHTVTFLAEWERDEQFTESAFSGPDDRQITNRGYVGEYRLDLWDRVFLSGGLRHDDNDELFDDATTYRITAAYLHDETGTRLHGSYGTGVKNPTLFELFGSTPTFIGNPNLSPEESEGWDAGVEQTLLDGRAVVDVTYFDNRISDLIRGSGLSAFNVPGTSRIRGVEVSGAARLLDRLDLNATYTFTDAEDSDGNELVRRARHQASFHANYAFEVFGRPGQAALGIVYNGGQEDEVFFNFFPVDVRRVTLDGYTLVDLAVSYEVFDGVEIFARGENLLDDDYQEVFGFGSPGIGAFAGVRITYGPR